jgi:hypothetical protein
VKVFSWFRRKLKVGEMQRAGTRSGDAAHIRVVNPWHAVGVSVGKPCCQAAAAARNVRYLSSEAPTLPLSGCTLSKQCLCKYRHFSDRRRGPRRDVERFENKLSRPIVSASMNERRVSRGRRATDGH